MNDFFFIEVTTIHDNVRRLLPPGTNNIAYSSSELNGEQRAWGLLVEHLDAAQLADLKDNGAFTVTA
jgi:hypothetical protein